LKELSARLVAAQENERRAISRELHDEVGQSLSALLVGLSNLSAALPDSTRPEVREQVAGIRALAENNVAVVRNMALLLRPSMLDDLGLVPALQWQARETSRNTGIQVNVAADGVSDDLPEEHKTCIYRVVQEALHNCARHSGARQVEVAVIQNPGDIVVTIQDDGRGFEPAAERGLGLLGIEERVTHLGGALRVDAHRGQGALLAMTLPLTNHNGEHPNSAG
jgi:signal transduction histidine kinase